MARQRACTRSTCRAARRNAVLRPKDGSPGVWRGVAARYEPYHNPSFRIVMKIAGQRGPAKTYKPNGAREIARRKRQREQLEARAS